MTEEKPSEKPISEKTVQPEISENTLEVNVVDVDYEKFQKVVSSLDDDTINYVMNKLYNVFELYRVSQNVSLDVCMDAIKSPDYFLVEALLLLKKINIIS